MTTRDLGFNIFANADKALEALARASGAVDRLADRVVRLGNQRARPTVTIDTAKIEAQISAVEKKLDALKAKKADPTIDANITLAESKLARITAQIDRLKATRADPVIDPQIADAEAKITALQRKLDALSRQSPSVVVTMQSGVINNQIAVLRAKLDALALKRVDPKVDLQIGDLEAKVVLVQAQIDSLKAKKADVKIDADIKSFEAKLVVLLAELEAAKLAGGRIGVGNATTASNARSLTQQVNLLGAGLLNAVRSSATLAGNFRGLAIVSSLSAGIPTIVSLAATLAQASQAALLVPAALAGAGAAFTVLGIAFSGFIRALGPERTPAQIKQVELAMSKLSPTARDLVTQIRALLPAWHSIKMEIQDDVFKNVAPSFKLMAMTYIPVFKSGLGQVAVEINKTVVELMKWLTGTAQVSDTQRIFHNTALTINEMRPATIAVGDAFKNLAVVGSQFLPGLGHSFTSVAFQFDAFINKARNDGSLEIWIANGMIAFKQLGQLVANLGHILGDLFTASRAAGASTIQIMNDATSALHDFFSSVQGQAGLINLFQGVRQTIQAIKPGVVAILGAIADGVGIIRPTVVALGGAFSNIAIALAPAVPMIATLVADLGGPLLAVINGVVNAFGGFLPLIFTTIVAFKGLTIAAALFATVGGGIARVGAALGTVATAAAVAGTSMGLGAGAMTGLANAGAKAETAATKLGSAISKAGAALPIVGAAIIGLTFAVDALSTHYEDSANKVIQGSQSIGQAIAEEADQINKGNPTWLNGTTAQEQYAEATQKTSAEIQAELEKLGPLARAQAEVTIAEGRYQDELKAGGPASAASRAAADQVAGAKQRLKEVTDQVAGATRTETEVLIDNARQVAGAANADLAMEQAQIRLDGQIKTTNDTLHKHNITTIEGRQAAADLKQAYLDVAAAAATKAEADAVARGEADSAAQGAKAYRDKLIELAAQASGPTRKALLDMALATTTAGDSAGQAQIRALQYKDQLTSLANNASGPTKASLLGLVKDFDTLGGAHATASQRSAAQEAALRTLASQASGPTRDALLKMADTLHNLPADTTVRVTATGVLSGVDLLRASHGGFTGGIVDVGGPAVRIHHKLASGGVLPGYTPGRDVHHFAGRAGNLSLSGGEAIMRPEWTRAMGPNYVHGANRAARSGGVMGVRSFHASGGFSSGGVVGHEGMGSFAGGGVVMNGVQPFDDLARRDYNQVVLAMQAVLVPIMQKMVAAAEAAARAAAIAAAGPPGGFGGGTASAGGAMGWVMQHESGGRNVPNASGASTASGYFQMINGTWKAYGGSTPRAMDASYAEQAAVATRYVNARYGGWGGAQAYWMAHGNYDQGGIASSSGIMAKMSNKPERVLSPRQTDSFESMVASLESIRSRAFGSATDPGGHIASEVALLRSDVAVLGETIRETVKTARPITVEDHSGDPRETGRAVALALRL